MHDHHHQTGDQGYLLPASVREFRDLAQRIVQDELLPLERRAETDEAAMAKWKKYNEGADMSAMAWMAGQADADPNAPEGGTAKAISAPEGAISWRIPLHHGVPGTTTA